MSRALVFTLLRHAEDFPWRMVDIGLMGLRLDERREYRLHVWNPDFGAGEVPIHDHPYDFSSAVIVGQLTNTRYTESAGGDEYVRFRYYPPAEDQRQADTVRLTAQPEVLGAGGEYHQFARELHTSTQQPGTVTLIRCSWVDHGELTVCLRDEAAWRSGQARAATADEIKTFAGKALEWF